MNIHIGTSVVCLIVQTLVLRIPALRSRVGLPPIPPLKSGQRFPTVVDSWNFWRREPDLQYAKQTERERKMRKTRK